MGADFSKDIKNEDLNDINRNGFSDQQLQIIGATFKDLCYPEKTLGIAKFAKMNYISVELARPLFDFINMNGDNNIDEYEFICALALFMKSDIDERVEAIYALYDTDRTMSLDSIELVTLITLILMAGNKGVQPTKKKVDDKISEIYHSEKLKPGRPLYVTEFQKIAYTDIEIRNGLMVLGVMLPDEIEEQQDGDIYDYDINEEISMQNDTTHDAEYMARKAGIEDEESGVGSGGGVFREEKKAVEDDFMSKPAWKNAVTAPSNYKYKAGDEESPDAVLELDHVYGYRCNDCRNNLSYCMDGENLQFHTAAVGIVHNIPENKQTHVFENTDDIISMAFCGDLCATGEIGTKPVISLWDSSNLKVYGNIASVLTKGVGHLAFSNDGKKLAALSVENPPMLAVFDVEKWKAGEHRRVGNADPPCLIVKIQGPNDIIFDMTWNKFHDKVVISTKRDVHWVNITRKVTDTGSGWDLKDKCSTLSLGLIDDDIFGCTIRGTIVRWKSIMFEKEIKAHKGAIYCSCDWKRSDKNQVLTGGADGFIRFWNNTLEQINEINCTVLHSVCHKIRAISVHPTEEKLLAGTRGGEIFELEMKNKKPKVIINSHYKGELWGQSIHPKKNHFVTVGEDFFLSKWDMDLRKQIGHYHMEYQACAVQYNNKGTHFIVGCRNGKALIFDDAGKSDHLKPLDKCLPGDRFKELTEFKFSTDDKQLAVGGMDARIFIHNGETWEYLRVLKGHHATINYIDFSVDGKFQHSVDTSYSLLYWNVIEGKLQPNGVELLKDEVWKTWTTTLGWATKGIWPACSDGSDINACSRSHNNKYISTADDFGKVKLFKYPQPNNKAQYQKFIGHSAQVTNVKFSWNDTHVITTGGEDKAIFQWKLIPGEAADNTEYDDGDFDPSEFESSKKDNDAYDDPDKQKEAKQNEPQQIGMFTMEEETGGDQFMAVKPFKGQVDHSTPEQYQKLDPLDSIPPETNLEPHYINGYRCFDARQTAMFMETPDKVCFVSAALGVVMDVPKNEQKFFRKHDEDIVSFDLHKDKKIAASGSMPAKGKSRFVDIYVWDTETFEPLAHLTGFHKGSIKLLKFSPDGTKLVTFGQDDDNSQAIYDWENSKLLTTAKVDKAAVLGCGWKSDSEFCTVGSKHIKMWTFKSTSCSSKRGSWGSGKAEPLLEAVYRGNTCFTAGWKGKIYPWNGTSVGKGIPAHNCVMTLAEDPVDVNMLYSGGKDGLVKAWTVKGSSLTVIKEVANFSQISSFDPAIRNIDVFTDGSKLLIGTKGSELYVIDKNGAKTAEPFLTGHFDGETWGLCVSPESQYYATSGDDMAIMKWDAIKKKRVGFCKHERMVRALDWSSNGKFIIAGDYEAEILLIDAEKFEIIARQKSSFNRGKQWIEDLKISPDNTMIAFGTHMGVSKMEIMFVENDRTLKKGKAYNIGFTSALTHIDWTKDSIGVVATSQAYELYWATTTGSNINASATKDFEYQTFTCTLGWQVQGIFPAVDGTEVNSVCRNKQGNFMVTGTDSQQVNLFKFPSTAPKSGHKSYNGHASHVTKVKFMLDDNIVVSTGGNDKTNIIWHTDFGTDNSLFEGTAQEEDEFNDGPKLRKDKNKTGLDKYGKPIKDNGSNANDYDNQDPQAFREEIVDGGDEFMAVKPWLGAIKAPTTFARPQRDFDKAPEFDLTLEYVHGFRCKDARSNIFYNSEGKIVTHAAAVGLTHDVESNTQTHNQTHIDDIMSIAKHPDGNLFATGEIGPKPHLIIWDSANNNETKFNIRKVLTKGVDCLGFSTDGNLLTAVCMDDNHNVVVFKMNGDAEPTVVGSSKGGTKTVIGIEWDSPTTFVTYGIHHMMYWNCNGQSPPKGKNGKPSAGFSDTIVSAAVCGNNMLHGAANGELQVWSKGGMMRGFGKKEKLHGSCLDAICVVPNKYVITGGKDHMLCVLNQDASKVLKKIDTYSLFPLTFNGNVRALAYKEAENKLAVGLFCSEIYECTLTDIENAKVEIKSVLSGHYSHSTVWTNEVWGLERFNKDDDKYLTCSQDGTLREWSVSKKCQLRAMRLDIDEKGSVLPLSTEPKSKNDVQEKGKLMCVGIDMTDKTAVVGCKDGTVRFIDLSKKEMKQKSMIKLAKEWISDIKFSPNNDKLAIGSHDDAIYILSYPECKLARGARMKKHSSFITHLDWSTDGNFLHSTCGAYELLFWDANGFKQMTSGATALRDEWWHTWSTVLGWPVEGIFRDNWDGSDVNMVWRSDTEFGNDMKYYLLATADDKSNIRMYRWPNLKKNSDSVTGYGHSSHVTNVRFMKNDEYIISTGGEDQCVFQWKVTRTHK